jgi:hypothetical protein
MRYEAAFVPGGGFAIRLACDGKRIMSSMRSPRSRQLSSSALLFGGYGAPYFCRADLAVMAHIDHGTYRFEDPEFQTWGSGRRAID